MLGLCCVLGRDVSRSPEGGNCERFSSTTQCENSGFIFGLASYYCRSALWSHKERSGVWSSQCEEAFQKLPLGSLITWPSELKCLPHRTSLHWLLPNFSWRILCVGMVPVQLLGRHFSDAESVQGLGGGESKYHSLPSSDRWARWAIQSHSNKDVGQDHGEKWLYIHLPYVLFSYRASIQELTGESPFFLLHGCDCSLPPVLNLEPSQ